MKMVNSTALIMGGRLQELYEGNIYSVQPATSKAKEAQSETTKATVFKVAGLVKAKTTWHPGTAWPQTGAVAFLEKLSLHKWAVVLQEESPGSLPSLEERIMESKYLRVELMGKTTLPLSYFNMMLAVVSLLCSTRTASRSEIRG